MTLKVKGIKVIFWCRQLNEENIKRNNKKIKRRRREVQAKLDGQDEERLNKRKKCKLEEEAFNEKIKEKQNALVDKLKTGDFAPDDVESFNKGLYEVSL